MSDKRKQLMHDYYLANQTVLKIRAAKWANENHSRVLYSVCKRRAKKQGLPFTITIEDIIIPEYCPYLNIKLTSIQGQGKVDSNASVDRIEPKLGYTKDNIIIVSHLANRMKNSATKEQLITFAKAILNLYDN